MSDRLSDVRDGGMTERAVRTQGDILDVATAEFAANGYAGARVDEIAARTRTTKRMIYYYFGSKEGLYLAVLERVYAQIRQVERGIQIDELSPDEALRKLAEATYDHHTTHEAFIQLVSIENIHRAEHLRQSETILRENVTAITLLEEVIERGVRDGIFRDDIDARRRAHDDQRLRMLPCRQPAHVRRDLRSGHARRRRCRTPIGVSSAT